MDIPKINNTLMYKDSFTILRLEKDRMPDNTMRQELVKVASLRDKPCRVSRAGQDSGNMDSDTINPVSVDLMLFTDTAYDVRSGDTVEVTSRGITNTYLAGESYHYDNHQQINLARKGES